MTQQYVDGSDRRNLCFSWAYSAQTVHPPPKLPHERHIFGRQSLFRQPLFRQSTARLN